MTSSKVAGRAGIRPIRDKLLLGIDRGLEDVRLAGSHCKSCDETVLGALDVCPNCGSSDVEHRPLNNNGVIWSYTVARHKPPGDYRGPEPFKPFGIALVEFPEGLRVLTRVDCDVVELRVGLPVTFTPYMRRDADGESVITFTYIPSGRSSS